MTFVCESCTFIFDEPKEKIEHDGIITRRYLMCPKCDSMNYFENIKTLKGFKSMDEWVKRKVQ